MCLGVAGREGRQALQVFDYKAPRASDNGLKIRVSVVSIPPLATTKNKNLGAKNKQSRME